MPRDIQYGCDLLSRIVITTGRDGLCQPTAAGDENLVIPAADCFHTPRPLSSNVWSVGEKQPMAITPLQPIGAGKIARHNLRFLQTSHNARNTRHRTVLAGVARADPPRIE